MLRVIIILLSIILSTGVYAKTMDEMLNHNQYVLGISAGPTWASGNKTQVIFLEPDVQKTFTADNGSTVFPTVEAFFGLQKKLTHTVMKQSLTSQYGLSIVGAGTAKFSGDIWEDSDPAFNNFNYNYKVNHAHVALKARLIADSCRVFQPFISGSLGLGFNRAYDYTVTPKIAEEVPAPLFRSNLTTSFIYTIGIGLQKAINPQLQAAIGYEFANWGKTQLSPALGQTTNQKLSINHLYEQQIQLSLFYLF